MGNRIFHRRASDLGEIDVAFVKTFALATVGVILFYLALRMNGISMDSFGYGRLFLIAIGIYIVCFLITESQSHHLSFYVGDKRVYMDYEMKNGEVLSFTDVKLKHWWIYRMPSGQNGQRGTSTDLYVLVEDENGDQLLLKDEQMA